MTSAGAIKFYANHLYPGRCPLRSSRFSTPTFRSVNHFSHPFFNETETQKHQELSCDVFVLMHTTHTCTYHGCLFFFIFTFHASHFVTRQENGGREREKLILTFVRERIIEEESKKLDPFWRWVRVWRTIGTWIDQQFFAFSSDNLNPFKGGSLGKIREGIRM